MSEVEKKIVCVLEKHLDTFTEKIVKINRRIIKKGIPSFLSATFIETKNKELSDECGRKQVVVCHVYELEFPKIALPGEWQVIGEITEGETTEKGIFNFVNGYGNLQKYVSWDLCDCSHCGIRRHRKHSIILKNNVGEEVVVGSSCLKDFVGHDPEAAVFLLQFLDEFSGFGNIGEEDKNSSLYNIEYFLRTTIHALKISGWRFVSKKKASEEDITPTVTISADIFFDIHAKIYPEFISDRYSEFYNNLVSELMVRLDNLSERLGEEMNDFEQKVSIIARRGVVNLLNFQASILCAWISKNVLEIVNPVYPSSSELFGVVGEKISMSVLPKKCHVHSGQYGNVYIISGIVVGTNNKWTWFGTGKAVNDIVNEHDIVIEKEINITATIKNHESGKYGNNTILTRLKIVK